MKAITLLLHSPKIQLDIACMTVISPSLLKYESKTVRFDLWVLIFLRYDLEETGWCSGVTTINLPYLKLKESSYLSHFYLISISFLSMF